MSTAVLDRELQRLEGLWADGLSETYRSYLDAVATHAPDAQPRLALAAALVEVGLRLQGLGSAAAPPAALLMGDLCLARSSRILTDSATRPVQVAFARAVEQLSSAAAARADAPPVRELLLHALAAR
ncbi:MAG TPA: hypothetical protein VFJ24_01550 [Gaiellales bacterium]|nr:hypothetical protein [Gaiellales bacterium]